MSREAFGDPPEGQEPPQTCPVCGEEWHTEGCEFGEEVSRRLKAERDAHKLAFPFSAIYLASAAAFALKRPTTACAKSPMCGAAK